MNIDLTQLNRLSGFTRFACMGGMSDVNTDKVRVAQLDTNGRDVIGNNSDKPGFWGSLFRSRDNKQLNNQTRELFKETIAKLFGGEENIPQEVKDAMHIRRFDGKGRPLTAKRINETKTAVINCLVKEKAGGLSALQMAMVLNTSDKVEMYLKNDPKESNEIVTSTTASINDAGDEDNNIINTNTIKEAPKPQGNTQTQQTVKKGGIYDNPAFKAMNGKMMHNLPVGGTPQDVQKALNPNSGTKIVVEHKSEDEILDMKPTQQGKKPKAKKPKFFTEN